MRWLATGAAVFLIGLGSAQAQPPPPPGYAPIPPPRGEVRAAAAGRADGLAAGPLALGRLPIRVGRRALHRNAGPIHGHWAEGRWVWAPHEGRWIWRPAHWE